MWIFLVDNYKYLKEDSWWQGFFWYCILSLIIKMHFYLFECSNTISHWWLNLAQVGEAELKIWILLWVVYWLILSVVQGMSLKIECPWKLTRNVDFILSWVLTLFWHPFVFGYDNELKQKSEPWHVSCRAKLTRFILCINFVKFMHLTLQWSRCFRQGSDTFCAEQSEWTYKRTITSSQYPLKFLT